MGECIEILLGQTEEKHPASPFAAETSAAVILPKLGFGYLKKPDLFTVTEESGRLPAGQYRFFPVPTGLEDQANRVLGQLEPLLPGLQGVIDHHSATLSASKAKESDVQALFKNLRIDVLPAEDNNCTWEELVGEDGLAESNVWDATPEPSQKEMYNKMLQERARKVWRDLSVVRGDNVAPPKFSFRGAGRPVTSLKDSIVVPRRYHVTPKTGGLIAVELKKRLARQHFNQVQMEGLVWSNSSYFPLVQMLTDLQRGGLALWYEGRQGDRHVFLYKLLCGMDAFWSFYESTLAAAKVAFESMPGGVVNPTDELPEPKRSRMDLPLQRMTLDEVVDFVVDFFDKDVANLADLACFEKSRLSAYPSYIV